MIEITKAKMLELYENGLVSELINVGDKVIGRSVEGQANNPKGFIVVWCSI